MLSCITSPSCIRSASTFVQLFHHFKAQVNLFTLNTMIRLKKSWKTTEKQVIINWSTSPLQFSINSQMLNRMHLDPWSPSTIRPLWHSACHMCRLDISAWNQKWRFKIFHWIFSLLFLTIPVQFFGWQNRNFCLWTLGIAQSQNQWSVWHLNYRSLACVFEEFRFCYFIFCFVLNLLSRMPFHF